MMVKMAIRHKNADSRNIAQFRSDKFPASLSHTSNKYPIYHVTARKLFVRKLIVPFD